MGTNYYMVDKSKYCSCCGLGEKEIHLGKSSMGWCFSLHVYPEKNINNLDDVINMIGNNKIKDEYGDKISKKEFLNIVKNRSAEHIKIPFGYKSWDDFYKLNHGIPGPNNLIRAKISSHCIGHGDGTWDYMVGEYS